jgi:segregation and condensation protein A
MNNIDVDTKIKINEFEASTNELIKKIKENIIDIDLVSITEIINQYLQYVIKNRNIIDLSNAGKIINNMVMILKIKSEYLLPKLEIKNNEREDNEDNDFATSKEKESYIQEYNKFQKVVEYLKEKEGDQNNIYFPMMESRIKKDNIEIQKVDLADLLVCLEKALLSKKKKEFIPIKKRIFTINTKMKEILNLLKNIKEGFSFEYFMERAQSKLEIIVIFLALLELIYLKKINCFQNKSFDKIIFNMKGDALN